MECDDFRDILSKNIGSPVFPLSSPGYMDDGNMDNLSPTIPINISCDPGKVENVYIGAGCSLDEILRMSTLGGRVVPLMRSRSIPSCLKSFVTFSLGHTKKCRVYTLVLLNIKSKCIQTQN